MLKLFKNAFKYTNEGIILATPLILFIWLIVIYLGFAKSVADTLPEIISATLTLVCMIGAFMSGWFYMVKKSIEISNKDYILDNDRSRASLNLIKEMPAGIGKYFLSFVGMSLCTFLIFALFGVAVYKIGMHFIGSIDFTPAQIKEAMASPQDMRVFLDSLTIEQLYKLGNWNFLFLISSSILSFLLMLWIPEIIYKTLNPIGALFGSIGKIFKRFGKSLFIFIYLSILNFIISFANTFSVLNPLLYMLMMIVYFYFLVYVVVLIFSYYDSEFNKEESNSDSRSDC